MPEQIKIKIEKDAIELELPFVEVAILEALLQTIIALQVKLLNIGE